MIEQQTASAPFPRTPLLGAAALLTLAFVLAMTARQTEVGTTRLQYSTPVESRELRFEDRPDGAVAVFDAKTGEAVNVLAAGTNGFVRIVMRGIARDRILQGIGSEQAFVLTRWEDGRLSITDPTTGKQVELLGFGSSNVGVFAQLLKSKGNAPK